MSGIVNSTGAVSGVVGTTVGTPVTDLSTATFPAGHVIQIVNGTYAAQTLSTSTSFVSVHSNLEPSITPSSASHKIFVQFDAGGCYTSTDSMYMGVQLFRDSTALGGSSWGFGVLYQAGGTDTMGEISGSILDSPNTTSSVQYKIYQRVNGGQGGVCMNNTRASITLMEVVV